VDFASLVAISSVDLEYAF